MAPNKMAASSDELPRLRASRSSKKGERERKQQAVSTRTSAPSRYLGLEAQTLQTTLRLVLMFTAWKTLLLVIAFASPGPAYDTSSELLPFFERKHALKDDRASSSTLQWIIHRLSLRLTRWDAVYFTAAADRGHIFEQEWAFSPFLATLNSRLTRCASFPLTFLRYLARIDICSQINVHMLIMSCFCSSHNCSDFTPRS
jgi:hypothetical protein